MAFMRQEKPEDINSVRYVNEQAFGGKIEAGITNRLREKKSAILSLVAVQGNQIVGHIMFSPVEVVSEGSSFKAISLAPMAVLPAHQRQGIGSQLVRAGLDECRRRGHEIVLVVGHPDYYPRFGFLPARPKGIHCEFEVPEEAWMILELKEGALAGRRDTAIFAPEFKEAV